jgi:hypothetical protein
MISPSIFFKESATLCGEPGAEFVREQTSWKRPAVISHPTIRRIDWKRAAEPWPGVAPGFPLDASEDPVAYAAELFVWARAAWRGLFASQLSAIVQAQADSFDGRECHPFTLGYVRGAIWELLEHASVEESWQHSAFVAIGATADVCGVEWVDDIEDAIDDLKGCGLPPASRLAFQDGARRGIEDMEYYLAGTDLEPWGLAEWFEAGHAAMEPESRSREGGPAGALDATRLHGGMTAAATPDATVSGEVE